MKVPRTIPEPNPPPAPPKDWESRWKFQDQLNRQNPMLTIVGGKTYLVGDRTLGKEVKFDDDDEAKKKARVEAIKKANRAKRKGIGAKRNVSGTGTVTPILYSYPSGADGQATTGGGFSLSDVPSIVWIILAVGAGIFLIKSGRKRR